jgi:hypothetical protein
MGPKAEAIETAAAPIHAPTTSLLERRVICLTRNLPESVAGP